MPSTTALSIKWPKQIAACLTYFQVYLFLNFSNQIINKILPDVRETIAGLAATDIAILLSVQT